MIIGYELIEWINSDHPITRELLARALAVAIIVLLALLARWLLGKVIDRLVRRAELGLLPDRIQWLGSDNAAARRVQRARTMGSVLKSIASIVVFTIALLMILPELGVNVGPIVASAGIIGVALGFGAQSLVKDFLSGIFMIFEDQYGVGDVVNLGEASGTVEAVTLRVTRLRDVNGTVWYVRNGEILRVGNMSQNWARTVLDVPVSYSADLAQVRRVLLEVAHDLWEDEDFRGQIIEEPEVAGVESMTPEAVTVRVTMKTAPMQQWTVAREMRQRVKARFDHEGIAMPHPQRVIVQSDKPPAQ